MIDDLKQLKRYLFKYSKYIKIDIVKRANYISPECSLNIYCILLVLFRYRSTIIRTYNVIGISWLDRFAFPINTHLLLFFRFLIFATNLSIIYSTSFFINTFRTFRNF